MIATLAPPKKPKPIPAKWLKIIRQIPGYDPVATAGDAWFEPAAAQRALDFFQHETDGCLRHVEGALAGQLFKLEPWQQAIIANLFGWMRLDDHGRVVRRYREALIYVPRKNGKALALDTPIPTPEGWKAMGDLESGDRVFDETGKPCTVLTAFAPMHDHRCYRVSFSDGTSIIADEDHLWKTTTRKPQNKTAIRTTLQIRDTLSYGKRTTHNERNHSIAIAAPLATPAEILPINPYAMGVWLGDGDSDCARFTSDLREPDIVEYLQATGLVVTLQKKDRRSNAGRFLLQNPSNGKCRRGHDLKAHRNRRGGCDACARQVQRKRTYGTPLSPETNITFQEQLDQLGVLNNKHIPTIYLRASIVQRMALLQGLMDTDGTTFKDGQVELTTCSEQLREDALDLIRGLGFKPTWISSPAKFNGRTVGTKFRIRFAPTQERSVFRMRRKAARLPVAATRKARRSESRQIVAVEPVESEPVRCIAVDSPSRLYLAGEGMIPTHNTPLAAGICDYVLFCDGEPGAQISSFASDADQAAILYRHAKGMVEQEPELASRAKIYKGFGHRSIVLNEDEGSVYRVHAADAAGSHGGNPHLVIVDELHAQPNRELIDVLQTSFASVNRAQPLFICITTADFERESICNEKHDYAGKVRDGIIHNPAFLPVIYEADDEDDWTDPDVWAKANPNLGVSVSLDYLRGECQRAVESSAYRNTFKRLHLNIRTKSDVVWLRLEKWDACGTTPIDPRQLARRPCFGGLDLSTTTDISALELVFPEGEGFLVLSYFWVPRANAALRERRDRVPYTQWIRDGFIKATEGDVVDYDVIRGDINALAKQFQLKKLAIDRWNATQLAVQLGGDGITIEFFGQGFASMNAPSKLLENLVTARRLAHAGNPVLRWMASNVMVETDAAGNIKPSKKKSTERIDGMVALVMGLGAATSTVTTESVYRKGRGLVVL